MFEKSCPQCAKPLSVFSKGMLQGKFSCPHCAVNLKSKPSVVAMAVAGAIGGAVGMLLKLPLTITVPIALVLSYPFSITPIKSE